MGLSDSTADIVVTVLTVVSILALLSLPSHKTLLRGRKHIHCGLSAVTLAILSQIFTCAAYWQIAKESTVADYETNATFDKNKLTIILGAIGVVTLWIAQLQVVGLLIHRFSEFHPISKSIIHSKVVTFGSIAFWTVAILVSIVGQCYYWTDANTYATFAAIGSAVPLIVYIGIAILSTIGIKKHSTQLQSQFANEASFVAQKKRVHSAAFFMAISPFLIVVFGAITLAFQVGVDKLTESAVAGFAASAVSTPIMFGTVFHFVRELEVVLGVGPTSTKGV